MKSIQVQLSLFLFIVALIPIVRPFSLSSSNDYFQVFSVPTISASEFDPDTHYYLQTHQDENCDNKDERISRRTKEYETPVLIENALSSDKCEWICDTLVNCAGEILVDLQRKRRNRKVNKSQVDLYECTLNEAFDYMMGSKHEDAVFCFCERLLDDLSSSEEDIKRVKRILDDAKENIFVSDRENTNNSSVENKQDLFQYFPSGAKPSDCVILAGEGATSTLHRDPFEWTGTSICLEGTKVWRFLSPPGAGLNTVKSSSIEVDGSGVDIIDNALEAYRLSSVAWDDDGDGRDQKKKLSLSAGWQSDFSLYDFRDDNIIPSAKELAFMEDPDNIDSENIPRKKETLIQSLAANVDALKPNIPSIQCGKNGECCTAIWTVVQKPGDLLLIPAHWWHQTYALEPSLAVASQRCGLKRDAPRVIRHILETVGHSIENDVPDILKKTRFDLLTDTPQNVVDEMFDYLSKKKKLL